MTCSPPAGDLGGGDGLDNWLGAVGRHGHSTPFEKLRQSIKPVVSAVNGLVIGGLQIALCSEHGRVVSERATFRVPELYRGIADTYYSQMLARLIIGARPGTRCSPAGCSRRRPSTGAVVARAVPHDDLMPRPTRC